MSDSQKQNEMLRQFDAGLAKVKYELQKNLNELDPLNEERLDEFLSVFNQRLIVFQHEYLDFLARAQGEIESRVEECQLGSPSNEKMSHLKSMIFDGGIKSYFLPYSFMYWVVFMKPKRRALIRKKIVDKFNSEIAPKLREWAQSQIHE